jgi:Protein of unknown function (DUF3455)
MRRLIGFNRLLLVGIVAAAAVLSVTQVAQAGPPPPVVPSKIEVRDGNKVFLVGHGVGVQIYSCNTTSSGFAWGSSRPGRTCTTTTASSSSPTSAGQPGRPSTAAGSWASSWTLSPSMPPPWLLLSAASTAAGPDGDRLVATTYIQRIATTGGLAPPASECNATTAGTVAEVPYTADYYFWKKTGA